METEKEMIIEMIPFNPENVIPKEGKYLVKTESTHLKTIQFVQARCTIVWNEKKQQNITSVDVTNQIVKEISKEVIL